MGPRRERDLLSHNAKVGGTMDTPVLVAYATKAGSTRAVEDVAA